MGVDDDGNGVLDATEVDQTQYVCDGANGSASANTMLTIQSNPSTTACSGGGRVIQSGLDNGDGGGTAANGVLEIGEVDFTTTYCITAELPSLLKDIRSGSTGSSIDELVAIGSTLYFTANDGTNGEELWKSDGTASGTVMVKDIWSGSSSSNPTGLTVIGSTLYFAAEDAQYGVELWKSDGTSSGTVKVKDINSGSEN